jgi:iron complex transport system permease protein
MMLLMLLIGAVLASVGIGAVRISSGQIFAILIKQVGISLPLAFEEQQEVILVTIRLPRVVLGILVGAGLAVSGAAMQALFRNPLADPGLIGVSSGAALAAVSVIVLGARLFGGLSQVLGFFTLPVMAFIGGLGATLMVYKLSHVEGRIQVTTMLLAGIAVNTLAGAGIGLLTSIATDVQLRSITFWNLGSLGGATWATVGIGAPFILASIIFILRLSRPFNVLLLGETEAEHLGIPVEPLKRRVVILVAMMVGTAVSITGMIGFVGLIVPHLLRLMIGPDHRYLLPGSVLLGPCLLLGADLIARTLIAPAELPLGIVTAFLGAPFFLWLLWQDHRRGKFL